MVDSRSKSSSGRHYSGNSANHRARSNYDRAQLRLNSRYRSEDDFDSVISPCVKYSLFFFNFIFWVSQITR